MQADWGEERREEIEIKVNLQASLGAASFSAGGEPVPLIAAMSGKYVTQDVFSWAQGWPRRADVWFSGCDYGVELQHDSQSTLSQSRRDQGVTCLCASMCLLGTAAKSACCVNAAGFFRRDAQKPETATVPFKPPSGAYYGEVSPTDRPGIYFQVLSC